MPGFSGTRQKEWEHYQSGLSPLSGARSSLTVTPNDNADLTDANGNTLVSRAIYAHTAGNIAVDLADDNLGNTLTLAFAAGEIKPVQCRRIRSTGTTVVGTIYALF